MGVMWKYNPNSEFPQYASLYQPQLIGWVAHVQALNSWVVYRMQGTTPLLQRQLPPMTMEQAQAELEKLAPPAVVPPVHPSKELHK